ncbi:MAG TPA: VOC family protein [Solirubrobacteraceae bacterium]|jgi:lactoylglutathione lyase
MSPRTLHFGLKVAELDRSLAFYRALGYEVVGTVPSTPMGQLTMLKLPGDEFVTLELVAGPDGSVQSGGSLNHFVIRVESMRAALAELEARGLRRGPAESPDGSGEMLTAWISDPDGNRIELVQWPPGHPDGMTAADFAAPAP